MNPVLNPTRSTKAVLRSRLMREGARLCQDWLQSEKARNSAVWSDPRNWCLGYYFGRGDTRLWVPRKGFVEGQDERLVINFCHPRGREAGKVLLLAYVVCLLGAGVVGAIMFGYRW